MLSRIFFLILCFKIHNAKINEVKKLEAKIARSIFENFLKEWTSFFKLSLKLFFHKIGILKF
ncbi:hypothetical protein BpHYR1_033804 [Brachionus plicatilis]|uniref:Uncharacterized protein n=1 Tax=Brachionus plicatilis TaxID=10195 RepID=A0A3M7R5A7_BRAPC|nr:hypothetical protein BpHYR1_033804 [Brachionus plicatilis]